MPLNILKDKKEIGGFEVEHLGKMSELMHADPNKFIMFDHLHGCINIKMQTAPIGEVGIIGVQVDTIIHLARDIIAGFNEKYPDEDNKRAMGALESTLYHLEHRRRKRERKGIEGTSKESGRDEES